MAVKEKGIVTGVAGNTMIGEVLGKGKTYSTRLCESGSRESGEDDCVTHCEEYVRIRRSD